MPREDQRGSTDDLGSIGMFGDECRRTLAYQLESISELDAKAVSVFRTTVLIGALFLAVLSVLAETSPQMLSALANRYTGLGLTTLLVSSSMAVLAHTASRLETGIHPQHFVDVSDAGYTPLELEWGLTAGYTHWLARNQRTNMKKAALLTGSMVVLVAALVHISLGVYVAVVDRHTVALVLVSWIGLGLFTAASDLAGQVRTIHTARETPENLYEKRDDD